MMGIAISGFGALPQHSSSAFPASRCCTVCRTMAESSTTKTLIMLTSDGSRNHLRHVPTNSPFKESVARPAEVLCPHIDVIEQEALHDRFCIAKTDMRILERARKHIAAAVDPRFAEPRAHTAPDEELIHS